MAHLFTQPLPHWRLALPGALSHQVASRLLIHPGKTSRTNWSENKASLTQVEKKKVIRARVPLWKK